MFCSKKMNLLIGNIPAKSSKKIAATKKQTVQIANNSLSIFRPEENGTVNLADAHAHVFGNRFMRSACNFFGYQQFCNLCLLI